jgi:hypothetical protein
LVVGCPLSGGGGATEEGKLKRANKLKRKIYNFGKHKIFLDRENGPAFYGGIRSNISVLTKYTGETRLAKW